MSRTFEKGQHYMGLILCGAAVFAVGIFFGALARSEEHTSELQSR